VRALATATLFITVLLAPAAGQACPDSLTRDLREGIILPGRIEEIAAGMKEEGIEKCAEPLVQMARNELTSRTPSGVGSVAAKWGDPALLPLLYSAYAQGMLRPHERSDDLALAMAGAISIITEITAPGADLLAPLRESSIALDWLDQSAHRFTVEWQPAIESGQLQLVPFDSSVRAIAHDSFLSCLDTPEDVPPDTFDPLGLATGPGATLSIGTRCSTLAVLKAFRAASTKQEVERIDNLLRQYAPMGDFLDLAASLERNWKQGRTQWKDGAPPDRLAWQTPDAGLSSPLSGDPRFLALCIFLALSFLLAVLPPPEQMSRGKAWAMRTMALLFGCGLLPVADHMLASAGIMPGDEGRPTARLSLSVDPPPGRPGILLDQGGRAVTIPKPARTLRLGIAGASSVAGVNLAHRDTFSSNLEVLLREELPCVEVLNFGQPGLSLRDVRGTALAAADAFELDAVLLYSGHNEVGAAREHGPHRSLRGRAVALEAALVRTRLMGFLRRYLPQRDPNAPEESGATSESDEDMDRFMPAFEAAVNAQYRRELVDLVRAMKRRGLPLVLAMPAFNHHGLRLSTVPDMEGIPLEADGTTPANRISSLLEAGNYDQALKQARDLTDLIPEHGAPYLLTSFAQEGLGNITAAEASIWEAARRNQVGSALTPGLASVLLDVASRHQLPLADIHAALHEASPGHLPGFDLFVDFVHLSPKGSLVVAKEMAATLRESGLVSKWSGLCSQ